MWARPHRGGRRRGSVGKLTPMMRQYMLAKERHPDALLMFRLGDFYELFFDGENRIKKCHGILEDHSNPSSADLFHLFLRFFEKVCALKENLSGDDSGRRNRK